MAKSHWNRAARRSGGSRPVPIYLGRGTAWAIVGPRILRSIQCHESRHAECDGRMLLFPGPCECPCHCKSDEAA
jgi:hypothetical protein